MAEGGVADTKASKMGDHDCATTCASLSSAPVVVSPRVLSLRHSMRTTNAMVGAHAHVCSKSAMIERSFGRCICSMRYSQASQTNPALALQDYAACCCYYYR